MSISPSIRSILLHGKSVEDEALDGIRKVLQVLDDEGTSLAVTEPFATLLAEKGLRPTSAPPVSEPFDLVLCLGGDGTVLETASLNQARNVPVLGINTGRLGFLSHLPLDGGDEALRRILAGEYVVESRTMLEVVYPGKTFQHGGCALNEVTVHRRDVASMIRISVHREGTFVNRYWADGLIVSTATGSTAYSLSCGGPIVHPASNAIVLNPIAPHNLNDRPLVIPADGVLDIQAEGRDDHLMLTMDNRSHKVPAPSHFQVRRAERPFLLVQLPGVDFIETVRRKLHLGLDGREGISSPRGHEFGGDDR